MQKWPRYVQAQANQCPAVRRAPSRPLSVSGLRFTQLIVFDTAGQRSSQMSIVHPWQTSLYGGYAWLHPLESARHGTTDTHPCSNC